MSVVCLVPHKMNTIKYYEQNVEKIFNAVDCQSWRLWKTVDADGIVRQNKSIINSPQRLLKFISGTNNPVALYVSASTFLNPNKVHGDFPNQKKEHKNGYFYPRGGYLVADCIVLDSLFFVDIDADSLLDAQKEGLRLIKILDRDAWLTRYSIQFSGRRGFHLIYKHKHKSISDPKKRIDYFKSEKKRIVNSLPKSKLFDIHHKSIMQDVFRVYAAPYSIKANGGIVQPLTYEQFQDTQIIQDMAREASAKDMKVATGEGKPSTLKSIDGGQGAGLTSSIYFKFMDNMVRGLKDNYITVLKFNKKRYNIKILNKLQETYKLTDFYITEIGKYIYAYNTRIVKYKRLAKILRFAKSENYYKFLKTKHLPIQVTDSYDINSKVVEKNNFQYVYGTTNSKNYIHSKPHSILLGLKYDKMVGKPNKIGMMRVSS